MMHRIKGSVLRSVSPRTLQHSALVCGVALGALLACRSRETSSGVNDTTEAGSSPAFISGSVTLSAKSARVIPSSTAPSWSQIPVLASYTPISDLGPVTQRPPAVAGSGYGLTADFPNPPPPKPPIIAMDTEPELVIGWVGAESGMPFVTENWLYFDGAPADAPMYGRGVFRMKKQPGALPELLIQGLFPGDVGNYFYEAGMMYILAQNELYRWPEDDPSQMVKVKFEGDHRNFKSDADHFFAVTFGAEWVTLFDKQTLKPHSILISRLPMESGGDGTDVVSDGERLYCSAHRLPNGMVYVVNKRTEQVTELPIPSMLNPNFPTVMIPNQNLFGDGFFIDDGVLYGTQPGSMGLITLDTRSGEFKIPVMSAAPGIGYPVREPGSDVFYIAGAESVYRYHWRTQEVERLTPLGQFGWLAPTIALDATHVYFAGLSPLSGRKPLGIFRVPR